MKSKVYLETSFVSYLTSKPSRDLVLAAHQQVTREWWEKRSRFDLFISELVLREISVGNADAAARRLEAVQEIPIVALSDEATNLARIFVEQGPLPEKALADALHISLAVAGGIDFLVTWNCAHIANAQIRKRMEKICRNEGYEPPIICTPDELMEE
jgi:hypothetical protein